MAKRLKAHKANRANGPACPICLGAMTLRSTIPPAHIFPELRTYRCDGCGNLRTVEDERDLAASTVRKAA
ncbi:MAG TPA: hypothetical protein VHX39_21310 [Acetobacteraceae bacterium]|jgi:hypothetical protein|nr:hypothetical protein [Acetobacteraceae bacterium]